jgi:hypothetical protein
MSEDRRTEEAKKRCIQDITDALMEATIVEGAAAREAVMATMKDGRPLISAEFEAVAHELASKKAALAATAQMAAYTRAYIDAYVIELRTVFDRHLGAMEDVVESLQGEPAAPRRRRTRKARR